MEWPYSVPALYRWHVNGRYEYWPIDLYRYSPETSEYGEWVGDSQSIIIPRLSKKRAEEICRELNYSLSLGGMLYPIIK
jgi:hypothetical protein